MVVFCAMRSLVQHVHGCAMSFFVRCFTFERVMCVLRVFTFAPFTIIVVADVPLVAHVGLSAHRYPVSQLCIRFADASGRANGTDAHFVSVDRLCRLYDHPLAHGLVAVCALH